MAYNIFSLWCGTKAFKTPEPLTAPECQLVQTLLLSLGITTGNSAAALPSAMILCCGNPWPQVGKSNSNVKQPCWLQPNNACGSWQVQESIWTVVPSLESSSVNDGECHLIFFNCLEDPTEGHTGIVMSQWNYAVWKEIWTIPHQPHCPSWQPLPWHSAQAHLAQLCQHPCMDNQNYCGDHHICTHDMTWHDTTRHDMTWHNMI